MTLRELIDNLSDYDSESQVFDYKIQIQIPNERNMSPRLEDVVINEQAKLINLVIIKDWRLK